VLHQSPFDDLVVPVSQTPLDATLRDRWVKPLYLAVFNDFETVERVLLSQAREISPELIAALLAQVNWRPRLVGAFLVALEQRADFEEIVGRLLLRSDVCYAGRGYCLALARLNTLGALRFLQDYLRYYLTRVDLHFDQAVALAAVTHLDRVNDTRHADEFQPLWDQFVRDKPSWNLEAACATFDDSLRGVMSLRARCSPPSQPAG
jgi:hypothetical protein